MLTATTDIRGRVTLTTDTVGSSFVYSKRVVAGTYVDIETTASGTHIDQRPTRNYKYLPAQDASCVETGTFSNYNNAGQLSDGNNARSTITPTDKITITTPPCVEFGVLISRLKSNDPDDARELQLKTDGVETSTFNSINHPTIDAISTMAGGDAGLTLEVHTVDLTLTAAGRLIFDGYWYTDFSEIIDTVIEYKVVIDETTTETIQVTSSIDRSGVMNDLLDQIDVEFAAGRINDIAGYEKNEYISGLAMAYYISGRESLVGHAETIYDLYIAEMDVDKIISNGVDKTLVLNGRTPYNYWFAYKIFGDARYLTLSDDVLSYFVTTWPTGTGNYDSTDYLNICCHTKAGADPAEIPNMYASVCYSAALLYAEPDSAHYQSSAVLTFITNNGAWAMFNYVPSGELFYSTYDLRISRGYASYQYDCMLGVAENCSLWVSEVAVIQAFMATYGQNEPDMFIDTIYQEASNTEGYVLSTTPYYLEDVAIRDDYINLGYSAATAGTFFEYAPAGIVDKNYDLGELLWRGPFWSARSCYLNDVPVSVWGAATDNRMVTNLDGTEILTYAQYSNKTFSQDGIAYYRGVADGDAISVPAIGLTSY